MVANNIKISEKIKLAEYRKNYFKINKKTNPRDFS